jgi:hypothetical protein
MGLLSCYLFFSGARSCQLPRKPSLKNICPKTGGKIFFQQSLELNNGKDRSACPVTDSVSVTSLIWEK